MITPEQLKELRLKHKLTQLELGALIKKTKSCISNYETGTRNMDAGTYELMIIKLGDKK